MKKTNQPAKKSVFNAEQHEQYKRTIWFDTFNAFILRGKDVVDATKSAHDAVSAYDIEFGNL